MADDPSTERAGDDSNFKGIEITPEQAENMCRALAQSVPKLDFPVVTISESMKKALLKAAGLIDSRARLH